jgi:hypothetical protein
MQYSVETSPTYYMPQHSALNVPLNVMVRPSHIHALDRVVAGTPGVGNRSQAVRMLIEQADKALAAKA